MTAAPGTAGDRPPAILFLGSGSAGDGYPRPAVLAEGFRRHGIAVAQRSVPFVEGSDARVRAASGAFRLAGTALRAAGLLPALWRAHGGAPGAGAVLVGFPGHAAAWVARRRRRPGCPVLLDAFVSLHDTVVRDRGLVREGGLAARALRAADRAACRAADLVLVDTLAHADLFEREIGVPRHRIRCVRVGSPGPAPGTPAPGPGSPAGRLEVLWFGSYVPLQGASVVVDAAARLRGSGVRIRMIGAGQDLAAARLRAEAAGVGPPDLVRTESLVPRADLDRAMAAADACLGIFGTTAKASRVVPCKVYDALAAGRPLVTGDTPAAREVLEDGRNALLVPPGDPGALASALLRLRDDTGLRGRLAAGAAALHAERFRPERIVASLVEELWPTARAIA